MCIICIKKKSVKFPSMKAVRNMCENNNDGFAIVWYHPTMKQTQVYRTMNQKQFLKEFKRIKNAYDAEQTTLFIHARIKTHGTPNLNNCHGWVSDECGLAFAHNGILSGVANRDDMTDSETYFRDIFTPAFMYGGWEGAERTIKAIIGTSKFVFMDGVGNIAHYGQYIEDDGLLYSNTTYQPALWKSYTKSQYSSRVYPSASYDWDYDEWEPLSAYYK